MIPYHTTISLVRPAGGECRRLYARTVVFAVIALGLWYGYHVFPRGCEPPGTNVNMDTVFRSGLVETELMKRAGVSRRSDRSQVEFKVYFREPRGSVIPEPVIPGWDVETVWADWEPLVLRGGNPENYVYWIFASPERGSKSLPDAVFVTLNFGAVRRQIRVTRGRANDISDDDYSNRWWMVVPPIVTPAPMPELGTLDAEYLGLSISARGRSPVRWVNFRPAPIHELYRAASGRLPAEVVAAWPDGTLERARIRAEVIRKGGAVRWMDLRPGYDPKIVVRNYDLEPLKIGQPAPKTTSGTGIARRPRTGRA